MPIEIVPAVLARTKDQFQTRLRVAERLGKTLHIDIMDGSFVPSRSVGQDILRRYASRRPAEFHCMAKHPENWLGAMLPWKTKRIVVHLELGDHLRPVVALFRSRKIPVSLAINPATNLQKLVRWIPYLESVTVMGVRPGSYAAPFRPNAIGRITSLRRRWPKLKIACDGGVNPRTVDSILRAGANRLVVGSYLLQSKFPADALQDLKSSIAAVQRDMVQ